MQQLKINLRKKNQKNKSFKIKELKVPFLINLKSKLNY